MSDFKAISCIWLRNFLHLALIIPHQLLQKMGTQFKIVSLTFSFELQFYMCVFKPSL